jgi:hypothetical protein
MKTLRVPRCAKAAVAGAVLCTPLGLVVADTPAAANTQDPVPRYQQMARLREYLMDSAAEIALARSAAPAAISGNATILVLKPQGYETAVNGTNGFTCIVERAWMQPFDHSEFWNPKFKGVVCYNPAASKSVLTYTLRRTQLALAGHSRQQMLDEVRAAVMRKELPAPQPGAMSYMMSKDQYLGDDVVHWHSHLMFHVPKADAASWGANFPGSPVLLDDEHHEQPEPQTIFFVPVAHWSDGTAAPDM